MEQRFGFRSDDVPDHHRWPCGRWQKDCAQNAPPKPPPAGWFDPPDRRRALTIPVKRSAKRF